VSGEPSTSNATYPVVDELVEHLERLLMLRRFYRNCVRAQAYARCAASAYVPYTEEELAEFVLDEDREQAIENRKNEAFLVIVEMQVVKEQLKVCTCHLNSGELVWIGRPCHESSTCLCAALINACHSLQAKRMVGTDTHRPCICISFVISLSWCYSM
jgi:hypothetical protein